MLHILTDKTKLFVVCCVIAVTMFWGMTSIKSSIDAILVKAIIDSSKSKTAAAAAAAVPTSEAKPENFCYPPNRRAFARDQLPTVNVSTFDPRSIYVTGSDLSPILHQSKNYKNLTDFIEISSTAILSRRLLPSTHSIGILFSNPPFKDLVQPSCDGLWMEFGVFRGGSITAAANWKKKFCGKKQ